MHGKEKKKKIREEIPGMSIEDLGRQSFAGVVGIYIQSVQCSPCCPDLEPYLLVNDHFQHLTIMHIRKLAIGNSQTPGSLCVIINVVASSFGWIRTASWQEPIRR